MIDSPRSATLAEHLKAWLPARRWFGGKGRDIRQVVLGDRAELGTSPNVVLALIEVVYGAGQSERYFLPLREVADGPLDGLDDALTDEASNLALLAALDRSARLPTERGGVVAFERGPAFAALRRSMRRDSARPLGAEQSNSSIVFGDAIIMKAFRRVPEGPNPDLEVPRFLATHGGFECIPRLAGAVEYESPAGRRSSLAVLQEFVRSQGDGWSYTLRALAAGELREDSSYMAQARALAQVTAELHLALASDPAAPDFAPEPVSPHDLRVWRDGVLDQLWRSNAALRRALDNFDPALRQVAERVLAGEEGLMERADAVLGLQPGSLNKARLHGDYHLGQVLKTDDRWLVLDFEGEPLRSLAERRAKHCPLKDVAGMLRSFSYARQAALRDPGGVGPVPSGEALADWEQAVRTAFLGAYFERAGEAVFLPRDPSGVRRLLHAFELEKAAYELEYELNNRPDWVGLPLSYLAEAAD